MKRVSDRRRRRTRRGLDRGREIGDERMRILNALKLKPLAAAMRLARQQRGKELNK